MVATSETLQLIAKYSNSEKYGLYIIDLKPIKF